MSIIDFAKNIFRKKSGSLGLADLGLVGRVFGTSWSKGEHLQQYEKSLYVYACVSKIAEKYASIDFKLKRIVNSKGESEDILNHPILDLLYRLNPFMTKAEFFETDLINRKLSGDSFILKIRNNYGQVAELWPIRPDLVKIYPDPVSYINRYEITTSDGGTINVPPENMIHIKYPSPLETYFGISPLATAKARVNTEKYASEYQEEFFLNNSRPDAVFESEQIPTESQRSEIRGSWEKRHKGRGNNSKVGFLWGGLKYHQISLTQREMDFIESMKFTRDDILVAFKVPKPIVAITDDVNRANAETAQEIFLNETIIPEVKKLVDKLNEELIIPDFGEEFYLTFEDPVPVNREMRLTEFEKGVDRWITVNEARSEMGLEPIAGGDVLYRNISTIPLGTSVITQTPQDYSANLHGKKALRLKLQLKEQFAKEIKKMRQKVKKSLTKEVKDNSLFKNLDKRKEYWEFVVKNIDNKSKRVETLMNKIATEQMNAFVKKLGKKKPKNKSEVAQMFDIEKQIKEFAKAILPLIVSIFEEAQDDALDLVGEKKITSGIEKKLSPKVMGLLKARAAFFAESVNNTTLDKLALTLSEGIDNGESVPKLKDRVSEVYDEFPKYRANTIARTETNAVVNEANLNVYDEVKYIEGKEWIATLDDRVRDSHLLLDGEIVAKDKKFSNGLRYPGEAGGNADETINCRCAIAPVWNLKE